MWAGLLYKHRLLLQGFVTVKQTNASICWQPVWHPQNSINSIHLSKYTQLIGLRMKGQQFCCTPRILLFPFDQLFKSCCRQGNTPLTTSANAEITLPRVVRDLFIFAPSWENKNQYYIAIKTVEPWISVVLRCAALFPTVITVHTDSPCCSCPPQPRTFSRVPLAPVESARSLPARSTRLILLTWGRKHSNRSVSSWGIRARTELKCHCSEKQSEGHLSVTHLLCGKVGFCVVFLLSKDNCKHGVRAAAGFIHVGGCHSPKIWTERSMFKKGQLPAGLKAAAGEWEQEAAQGMCCPATKTQPHLTPLSNPFTFSTLNYSHLYHSLNRAFSICVLSSPPYMQTPRNTWAAFMWVFLTHC